MKGQYPRRLAKKIEPVISRATSLIEAGLRRNKVSPAIAQDLAFSCAVIHFELPLVKQALEDIARGNKITSRDLDELQTMLTITWPHHLSEIKKAFRKIPKRREREVYLQAKRLQTFCDLAQASFARYAKETKRVRHNHRNAA